MIRENNTKCIEDCCWHGIKTENGERLGSRICCFCGRKQVLKQKYTPLVGHGEYAPVEVVSEEWRDPISDKFMVKNYWKQWSVGCHWSNAAYPGAVISTTVGTKGNGYSAMVNFVEIGIFNSRIEAEKAIEKYVAI